jgi:RimJ/RimL family protein N-acetyltransferase
MSEALRHKICPMNESNARAIFAWRYAPPYDAYNQNSEALDSYLNLLLDAANAYHSISDEHGSLLGYCCFGLQAQIPDGEYNTPAIDVGIALRPDLLGRGLGISLPSEVVRFAREKFGQQKIRCTVAACDRQTLRVCEKIGFQQLYGFRRAIGEDVFVVLEMNPSEGD